MRLMVPKSDNQLLAIVSVDRAERVTCGQSGCGHSVFAQIHVVRADGELMVLGSTCFAKRFGGVDGLGSASFGGGGKGRLLTADERLLLMNNTAALLAQFENEQAKAIALATARQLVPAARPPIPLPSPTPFRPLIGGSGSPWAWMKPLSSTIYLHLKDASGWVRVQRTDGQHLLVPWPVFDGWDEALPLHVGSVDAKYEGYVLTDVIGALKYLRSLADWETSAGGWREVAAEIAMRIHRAK
jgi:hypothetical protein